MQLFAPTVLPLGALGGPTASSTLQLFALTVTTGAVAVSGAHILNAVSVTAPTVVAGAATVTGATVGPTAQLFAPSFIARLDGTFIGSGAMLFSPTVIATQAIAGAHCASTLTLFAASTLPSRMSVEPPGRRRVSCLRLQWPRAGSRLLAARSDGRPTLRAHCATGGRADRGGACAVGPPSVDASVLAVAGVAHVPTAVQMFGPGVTTGPVVIQMAPRLSTLQVFGPSCGAGITGSYASKDHAAVCSDSHRSCPDSGMADRDGVFPPSALPLGEMIGPTLPRGPKSFRRSWWRMRRHRIHDFVVGIVRDVTEVVEMCRSVEGAVTLTRAVSVVASLNRTLEVTSRVLVEREFAVGVER